ncbi:hypothetical protein [Nocardia nova]|uniref:hypothetical protein n=1 Tax=Nocardia nova TaxID=37330 RepID=UPI00340544FE
MVNPVWAGVIGGAIGSGTTALVSLASPFLLWRTESKKMDKTREAEKQAAQTQHRRDLVREWREGLAEAVKQGHEAQVKYDQGEEYSLQPLTGRAWFESLRSHLKFDSKTLFQVDENFHVTENAKRISNEIARIEKEWGLV